MGIWRCGLLLLALCLPVAAGPSDVVEAVVAGRRYAVPRALTDPENLLGLGTLWQVFSIQFIWPGLWPVPQGHSREYRDGLVSLVVQDISPGTQVENLAAVPGQRARFLKLWRDSTVDQFGLAEGFELSSLRPSATDEAARLGLQSLGPLDHADQAQGRRLFSDGASANLSVLMMCQVGLSCQLWWMQDEAAVEVTFEERILPDWLSMRQSAAMILAQMRAPGEGRP